MQQDQYAISMQKVGNILRRFLYISVAIVAVFSFSVVSVHAQLADGQQAVQETAAAAGVEGGVDLVQIIGRIINIFLGFLGIIFLGLLLYAGYLWMTAAGNEEQVAKAKTTIRNAIIGLVLIASAWSITFFILRALGGDEGSGGGIFSGGSGGGFGGGLIGSSGSLGIGVIEYHLPERNATDISRNTPIVITFKQPVRPSSFIDGWTEGANSTVGLNANAVKIFRTGTDPGSAFTSAQARVSFTPDHKTFVIRPVDLLGSPTVNVKYTVQLRGGTSGVMLENGSAAFSGSFNQGYEWSFEVSTIVDSTPPRVLSALPASGGKYARNILVQVTFTEAVDPTSAAGIFKSGAGFSNIRLQANGTSLEGEYRISNQYRTVEFLSAESCGVNSCGAQVFCLPPEVTIEGTVRAASIDVNNPPQAQFTNQGFDGVTDMAGNSLDGNGNSAAEGSPVDSYVWSFGTSQQMKLTPPKIIETVPDASPGTGQSNRPLDEIVEATFDTLMRASTLNSENARIEARGPGETDPDTFWYAVGMQLLTAGNMPVQPGEVAERSRLTIKHRPYLPSGVLLKDLNYYNNYILSDVQDAYQNCFAPSASQACTASKSQPNCCNNQPGEGECKLTL